MTTEFCPRCTWPLEPGPDVDRLCDACGWFGDQSETLLMPPQNTGNPFLAAVHGLAWFREVCRCEFLAEEYCRHVDPAARPQATAQLNRIRAELRHVGHALIERFRTIWGGATAKQQLRRINGVVPWPADWTDRHYNASREPCDCLVGPCLCGAWHTEDEDWVRAILFKHNAEIIDQ